MTEDERASYYPSMADAEVVDFVVGLSKVFATHKEILEKTGENVPYYPDEIIQYADFSYIDELWSDMNYREIRKRYVTAYMNYVEKIAGEAVYFTLDEFLNGTAVREMR